MNISYGLLPPLSEHIRQKQERYTALANRALATLEEIQKSGQLD